MMENQVNKDSEVRVTLERDKLKAYLEVIPPLGEGKKVTRQDIEAGLKEQLVVNGIKSNVIEEALQERNWGKKFVIAEGKPAVNGINAKITFNFPLPTERIGPKIDEEGVADYRDLGLIYNVKMGEKLAEKTPATLGNPGINVSGEEVPAKPGMDLRIPQGKNTVTNDQGTVLLAGIDGNATIRDNKIVVDPVYTLGGDVDFSSGNIQFVGNVVINGSVNQGFKVHAGGDIEILGFVDGAEIIAGGSIMVKGGINTGSKGLVKANGDISARFVENSFLEAGNDVLIREAIMQSTIRAGGSVRVRDKKATILGGVTQATMEVESRVLGSQLATATVVEVGVNPHYREEYFRLNKIRKEKKQVIENLNHNLNVYQRSGINPESLTPQKKANLIKMLDDFKNLRKEMQEIEERIIFLENEFINCQNSKVKVHDIVYPGVRISIGQSIYIVNDPIKYSAFVLEDGDVRISSID